MYQIRIKENKDFSERVCFLSRETFRPDKVIVTIERMCNGKFKTVGYISPSEIKEFTSWRKNLDDAETDATYFYLQACSCSTHGQIEDREHNISFLQSIITALNDEMREYKKCLAEQENVIDGAKNPKVTIPTLKEYNAAVKSERNN